MSRQNRLPTSAAPPTQGTPAPPATSSWPTATPRRYPHAAAALGGDAAEGGAAPVARVRPPVRRRAPPVAKGAAGLAEAAAAQLVQLPDGRKALHFTLTHAELGELHCSVETSATGLVATFHLADANTRRLFAAEAPRLRAQLAEQGLVVAAVQVAGPEP